jgi:hypothetical protein
VPTQLPQPEPDEQRRAGEGDGQTEEGADAHEARGRIAEGEAPRAGGAMRGSLIPR